MKVLLVDDDPDLLAVTAFALQQAGFLVIRASDGIAGLEAFERECPDVAVLDINLPRMNGFDLVRAIRQRSAAPILMLTVRAEDEDVVNALGQGADDYLTKPFSPRVLIARVRALARRGGIDTDATLRAGRLRLDVDGLTLAGLGEAPLRLTPLEARFLQLMLANAGRTVVTDRILVHVWGARSGGNRQLLKQLVHRLRQKLGPSAAVLVTVAGSGYALDISGLESAPPRSELEK